MSRILPRKLIVRLRRLGTKFSVRRTSHKLQRTQRRLQILEQERQLLMHQWSLLDQSLRQQVNQEQERRLPLPPELRTLDSYLQARETNRQQQQDSLQQVLQALGEVSHSPSQTSLPSSMLRPPT
jgi:hypothetical protein